MLFKEETIKYLNGEKFSNSLKILISKKENTITSRIKIAEEFSKNKKIIHVGCCDHIPLIHEKIIKNTWLHKRISEVASRCIGIDIDTNAIKFIKDHYNYENIFFGDVTAKDKIELISNETWDGMILGEILEHIDNPVEFLSAVRQNYKNNIRKLLITVPNAFCRLNFKNVKNHIELINSDHKYWFTPYTLAKIAYKSGFTVDNFCFTQEISKKIGMKARIKILPYIIRKIDYHNLLEHPALRSNLVMILNFNPDFLNI